MPRKSSGGAVAESFKDTGNDGLAEDLNVWDGYMTGTEDKRGGLAIESEIITLGFSTYIKDLPRLLQDQLEGHSVAYDGARRVCIAESADELEEKLRQRPDYHQRKDELFTTRITRADADEMGMAI